MTSAPQGGPIWGPEKWGRYFCEKSGPTIGEDVEGEREIGAAKRLSGNRTSELRNRRVELEFFRWFEGPPGRPGDMQGAEREGTGRVNLWPNFGRDSRDEAKLPRRRRVARVGRDQMEMGSAGARTKSVKMGARF